MNRRWQKRVRRRTSARTGSGGPQARARDLVGRDVSRVRLRDPRRAWLAFFVVALPFALGLAVLRVDVIRLRYALADAEKSERQLEEERRALVGEARALRHPERLAAEARRMDFGPARIVHLRAQPSSQHPVEGRPRDEARVASLATEVRP